MRYLLRRIALLVMVILAATTLNFTVPKLSPRNPVREKIMEQVQRGGFLQEGMEEMMKAYEAKFGLDRPVWQQYLTYLGDMARLDLGYSIALYPKKVMQLIGETLPWTIGLLTTSTIIAFILGTILGGLLAWPRAPRSLQVLVAPLFLTLSAIPFYLLGLVLIYFLAFRNPILPITGGYSIGTVPKLELSFVLDILRHSILPALSMVLAGMGGWALGMRGMMVTVQGEDYMTLAEAKGLRGSRIFLRYGMRNALLPQVTALALSLGRVASGAALVETVFGYPGIGTLLAQSIRYFDYFTIYGVILIVILGIALATLLMDLTYPLLDPRIKYERG